MHIMFVVAEENGLGSALEPGRGHVACHSYKQMSICFARGVPQVHVPPCRYVSGMRSSNRNFLKISRILGVGATARYLTTPWYFPNDLGHASRTTEELGEYYELHDVRPGRLPNWRPLWSLSSSRRSKSAPRFGSREESPPLSTVIALDSESGRGSALW